MSPSGLLTSVTLITRPSTVAPAVIRHITVSAVPNGTTFRIVTTRDEKAVGVCWEGGKRERAPRVVAMDLSVNLHDSQYVFRVVY